MDSTGSCSVQFLICLTVTGENFIVSSSNTNSSGIGISLGCSGDENRLSRSAFAVFFAWHILKFVLVSTEGKCPVLYFC